MDVRRFVLLSLLFFFGFQLSKSDDIKYSVNLLWINKEYDESQKYVLPIRDRNGVNLLQSVSRWSKNTDPETAVNLWFDSYNCSPESIKNTQSLIDNNNVNKKGKAAKVYLRDIRELKYVKDNNIGFSRLIDNIFF